jgi:hypothetical protein
MVGHEQINEVNKINNVNTFTEQQQQQQQNQAAWCTQSNATTANATTANNQPIQASNGMTPWSTATATAGN